MLLRIPIARRGSCAGATATHAVAPLRNVTKSRRFIFDQLPLETRRYHVWHGAGGRNFTERGGRPSHGRRPRLSPPRPAPKRQRRAEIRAKVWIRGKSVDGTSRPFRRAPRSERPF